MKNTFVRRLFFPSPAFFALSLVLLMPMCMPKPGLAAKNGSEDTVLYSLIESQRRDQKVCGGTPMPEAQSLIPSTELGDLAAASISSGSSPDAFIRANGLEGVPYLFARVPGKNPRQAFERLLSERCADIMESSYRYIGVSFQDGEWALLLSAGKPASVSASVNTVEQPRQEAILLAANSGGSLPVIPKVPERSKRAPRRPMDAAAAPAPAPAPAAVAPAPAPMPAAAAAPAPAPMPTAAAAPAPAPMPAAAPAPAAVAPAPAPAPAAVAPAPAPAPAATATLDPEPMPEPVSPARPVVAATPKAAAPLPFYEDGEAEPRRRTRPYDPNLVKDPSAAAPYVVREFEIGSADTPSDQATAKPVWMVEVPTPGPGPAPVIVSPLPSLPREALVAAGTPTSGAVPLYSTQPLAVSSPGGADPAASEPYPVGSVAVDNSGQRVGGHGAYPGAINAPWPSESAQVYNDVPPERTMYAVSGERHRPRPKPMAGLPPERVPAAMQMPSLPPERVSSPLPMEDVYNEPRALRPRR